MEDEPIDPDRIVGDVIRGIADRCHQCGKFTFHPRSWLGDFKFRINPIDCVWCGVPHEFGLLFVNGELKSEVAYDALDYTCPNCKKSMIIEKGDTDTEECPECKHRWLVIGVVNGETIEYKLVRP